MQGAAEVYPVSSSAQLALLPWLAGWEQPVDRTRFAAGLHLGSAVGLALALRRDLAAAPKGRLLLSAVPAALAGYVGHEAVERRLGRPGPTAALLAGAGAALWLADRRAAAASRPAAAAASRDRGDNGGALAPRSSPRSPKGMGGGAASLAQVLALAPGVSRTGATLTALRAQGIEREDAVRTSLLMSLPITLGAAGLTAVRGREVPPPVPTALACLTAYVAARRARPTSRFVTGAVLYRLGLAAAVGARLRKERS